MMIRIPRDKTNNQSNKAISDRQEFLTELTGRDYPHISSFSIDPQETANNIENFTGVAQIPIGLAGPLHIKGEFVNEELVIPMATTEGSLVASYSRGMKVLNLAGGVTTTLVDSRMQRAPVFVFSDARKAREFYRWIILNLKPIQAVCDATSKVGRLEFIERYLTNCYVYLRFNYFTGDAAGQNMVTRATEAGCRWIMEHYNGIDLFYLESNFATDKKASTINTLSTRGKRVVAEATIPEKVLLENLRVRPAHIAHHYNVAGHAAFVSGATNNGLQSANGITALFIATGQDVANVAESNAGIFHCEVTPDNALYLSFTIPSLIVGSYGGGTALPTQRECLEMLGAYGTGKVGRLTEIIAAVVLAGEISLAGAISSNEWVWAHESLGRNR